MMKELTIGSSSVQVTDCDVLSVLTEKIGKEHSPVPETCYAVAVGDLGEVIENCHLWHASLPSVEPFHVVRCNDDPAVLAILSQLGIGFVCYSKCEMQKVLKLHVPVSKIIYASPCRPSSQLHFAIQQGIDLLTFESIIELRKLASRHHNAQVILRVNAMADNCINQEGLELGCHPGDIAELLSAAKQLGVEVVGVSVHMVEDCPALLNSSIALGRAVFELGDGMGFNMTIFSLSGEFIPSKSSGSLFNEFVCELHATLEQYFSDRQNLRLIAECGSYLVKSAFTVAVDVLAEMAVADDLNLDDDVGNHDQKNVYYVSDGVYGAFSHHLTARSHFEPIVLNQSKCSNQPRFVSSIWGPTCDSLDCILPKCHLPRLEVGDWLAFGDMGWYLASADDKNGCLNLARYYVISERKWLQFCLMVEQQSCSQRERLLHSPQNYGSYKDSWNWSPT